LSQKIKLSISFLKLDIPHEKKPILAAILTFSREIHQLGTTARYLETRRDLPAQPFV
jgi:hypothetical protein